MKTIAPILLLVLAASAVQAAETPPPRSPLPAADCIRTDQINEWHIVDARTAIVRTGPKRYLVMLQSACSQLNHPPGLVFRASPANASVNQGRICGDLGETVHSSNQPPCAIQSVSKIDKPRFDQLAAAARQQRGAGRQSPTVPAH